MSRLRRTLRACMVAVATTAIALSPFTLLAHAAAIARGADCAHQQGHHADAPADKDHQHHDPCCDLAYANASPALMAAGAPLIVIGRVLHEARVELRSGAQVLRADHLLPFAHAPPSLVA